MAPKRQRRRAATSRQTLSDQLRALIDGRGLTAYAVGQLADVDPGMVQRFLTRQRGLRLDTVDRIASALGLRLAETAGRSRARTRARVPHPVEDTADGA